MNATQNTVRVECESGNVMVIEFGDFEVIENVNRGTIVEVAIVESFAAACAWAIKEAESAHPIAA